MKKILFLLLLILMAGPAARATEWWPFAEVNNKLDLSVNYGWHLDSHVGAMGFGVTIKGIHLTIGGVGSCKLPDGQKPSGRNTASAMIQAGYQIPVVRAFRIIPVVGTAAVGKIVYDTEGQENAKPGDDPKTRLDMRYRFDGGVHFVFNWRRLIVNAAITRYTAFGGIGIEF